MRREGRHGGWRLAALLLGASACGGDAPPVLRLVATHAGYEVPDAVRAGVVRVRLVNRDTVMHEASLARLLRPDATLADYLRLVASGDEFPDFARDVGGATLAAPGDSVEALVRLRPGRHVVASWYKDDVLRGHAAQFSATGDSTAARPAATGTVTLSDFAISMPTPARGRALLQVVNRGRETHEFTVVRLAEGRHAADYHAWRLAGDTGTAPGRPVAGVAALPPGGEAWAPVSWAPGRYVVSCAVDAVGERLGARHFAMGMWREFEVR